MDALGRIRELMNESLYDDTSFMKIPALMRSTFNLSGTWFMQGDLRTGRFETLLQSFPEDLERLYWQQYSENNIYTNTQTRFGSPNVPLNLDRHIDHVSLLSSQYYNELLVKAGIRYCMGLALTSKESTWVVGWHRSVKQDGFSRLDEEMMASIVPDLRRLAAVRSRLFDVLRAQQDMEDTLDLMPRAILSVSLKGRVLSANLAARRILDTRDGLIRTAGGELIPCDIATRGPFARMVVASCLRLPGTCHRLALNRPSGKPALLVDIVPSPQAGAGECIVVVSDPAQVPKNAEIKLRDFYGLTPAEARLGAALARGQKLNEISEELNVSINTLKTQLRSVMSKMNVSRQNDIIRIVERMPN